MASMYRLVAAALNQLSELTLATRHGICLKRQNVVYFCSSLSSNDSDQGNKTSAFSNRGVHDFRETDGSKKQSKSGKKQDWWRYKVVKLHRRKLTVAEKARDILLKEQMSQLSEEDTFGTLEKMNKSLHETSDTHITLNCRSSFVTAADPSIHKQKSYGWPGGYRGKADSTVSSTTFNPKPLLHHREKQRNSLVKVRKSKQWTETFGTLENLNEDKWMDDDGDKLDEKEMEYYSSDDEDNKPLRRLATHGKHSADWYARQMRHFADEGKIKEAIDVLDVWMLKNDRIHPNYYVFSVLISILGRAGYTKKAFRVFTQMKKMGIKPKPNTYTALFNACSNSPWPEDGLHRARNLQSLMAEKGITPNIITYRSMIKAYGVCGDIQAAFRALDEASLKCQPDHKSFNFLLMACCSDKEAGFRHAILVWRLMRQYHIQPTIFHYNLLLRVIRDCGIGDLNMAAKLIYGDEISAEQFGKNTSRALKIESGNLNDVESLDTNIEEHVPEGSYNARTERMLMDSDSMENTEEKSSLLKLTPDSSIASVCELPSFSDLHSVLDSPLHPSLRVEVDLKVLNTAEGRLALSGGVMGILSNMAADNVIPDIKTLSQLVNSIPSNIHAEKELICLVDEHNIRPDVDFFNMIIRKRNLRRDYDLARDLLTVIGQYKLLPNMMTFGCLAMGCRKRTDGLQLLEDMESSGLTPNREIFTILVFNSGSDFQYKLNLLQEMERRDLEPQNKLLIYVERKIQDAKEMIVMQEAGQAVPMFYTSSYFHEGYKSFMQFYESWLKRTPLEKQEHPWAKFRHPKESMNGEGDPEEMYEDKTAFLRTP